MPRPAAAPPPSRGWVLVPATEPGLLHRARSVVRASRDLVLVALDPGVGTPAHACLGVGVEFPWSSPRPARLVWLRDLTATETAAALAWIGGPLQGLADPPAALRHRIAATQPGGVQPRA